MPENDIISANQPPVPATPEKPRRKPILWYVVIGVLLVIGLFSLFAWTKTWNSATNQQKVYRIGILSGAPAHAPIIESFKKKMTNLGYNEGKNVTYDTKIINFKPEEERRVLQQFVQNKVDLIFVFPTGSAIIAKEVTQGTNIPVIFGATVIEGTDLIESVSKPGGNITGIRMFSPDSTIKRLEILHELAPTAKRINVIHSDYHAVPAHLEALRTAVSRMGLSLVDTKVKNLEDIKTYLAERGKSRDLGIDAIVILPDVMTSSPETLEVIGEFSSKYKIPVTTPTIFDTPGSKKMLFGYRVNLEEIGTEAAMSADKVLSGTPAGTIPVFSSNPELVLSYVAASTLGLTVPETVSSSAKLIIR